MATQILTRSLERHHEKSTEPSLAKIPPLQAGDRLSRAEFERRYLAQPEIKKAELLEGIVYMPSPVKLHCCMFFARGLRAKNMQLLSSN